MSFHLGAGPLVAALADSPFELTYMKAHEAAADFPLTRDALDAYAAVILSDLGANTLLLHPDVWFKGQPVPNRLRLLRDWVAGGGALMMIGGYYSFQGINGGARYHRTPVEEVLPVDCLPYDDRVEVPEGFSRRAARARPSDPRRARRPLAAAARLQRGPAQARAGRPPAGAAAGGAGRPPTAGHRHLRRGPHPRLDLGHRPALAAAELRRLAGLRAPLAPGADLADRCHMR